ncbi:MAG: hypothetical protein ACQEXN_12550 [Actinomycetota bacterium]
MTIRDIQYHLNSTIERDDLQNHRRSAGRETRPLASLCALTWTASSTTSGDHSSHGQKGRLTHVLGVMVAGRTPRLGEGKKSC